MTEYPAKLSPDWPPTHPGEILREDVLPALKMSVKDAAAELGVSRQMLHSILNGTASVTPEMALRLGQFCGKGPRPGPRGPQARGPWGAAGKTADHRDKTPTPPRAW